MRSILTVCALVALPSLATAQLPPPPVPPGNPITVPKLLLGKALFWDEQLSATRTVACGTCHFPEYGGSDRRSAHFPQENTHPGFDGIFGTADDVIGSSGVIRNLFGGFFEEESVFGLEPQVTPRKAPSFINAGYAPRLFWDGRAEGEFRDPDTGQLILAELGALENQALSPPVNAIEMGHVGIDWSEIATKIAPLRPLALATEIPTELSQFVEGHSYEELFGAAFDAPGVTPARIAMAIATYQRSLFSNEAKIDQFPNNFTELEQLGARVFDFQGRCARCHNGGILLFTDHSFRNIGLRPSHEDRGLGAITGDPEDDGKFRMPSLRNVSLRSPFFHNGSFETLREVVDFYDRGGDFHEDQDPEIIPLGLTPLEKEGLVAYLETFTDDRVHFRQPPFDRPTLYTETMRVPIVFGSGIPGAGGNTPVVIANEPPSLTNPEFTVGVRNARGGARALLLLSAPQGGAPFAAGATPFANLPLAFGAPYLLVPAGRLAPGGPGDGWGSVVLDLERLGGQAVGETLLGQWLVADPAAPNGIASASEAFEARLF